MAKTLSTVLGTDLAGLAQLLRSKGRGKDSILAHINPQEAALLKRNGGSGEPNPETGLPEFQQDYSFGEFYDTSPQQDYSFGEFYDPSPANAIDTSSGNISGYDPSVDYGNRGYDTPITGTGVTAPVGQEIQGGYYPQGATVYSPLKYNEQDVNRILVNQAPGQQFAPGQKPEAGILDEFTKQAKSALTKPENLGRLGLAGGLGLIGAFQNKRQGQQAQAATAEQKAIAQPYTETGQKIMTQAQAGQLTPQSQASLDAAKARIAQSVAGRGGVGQQQSANQIAQIYNNLLDSQYKYGLQVAQIGDNIALGAIRTGLQMDRSMAQSTNNFYTQLAQIAGGGTYGYAPPTVVRGV
jgi:hypothetical protein